MQQNPKFNTVLTFIYVLHELLFVDLKSHVPSQFKNKISASAAFANFANCRMIVDCTDIEVVTPKRNGFTMTIKFCQ